MEEPLMNKEIDYNIEINIHPPPQIKLPYEKFYTDIDKPPHNSKKITKIVCSSDTKYIVTYSEEDKSICGWPADDDDDDEIYEGKEGKELRCNARFQKKEIKDLLMVSNDKYVLIKIFGKTNDEFRIVKLGEKENEIFYVRGDPNSDQGTFISGNNDFIIVYKNELEAYVYSTNQTIVNKQRDDYQKDITTTWQLKSKYKFVFPLQFWKKGTKPPIGLFLTPEKLFLTYKGSNTLSQWDLFTMRFDKQYLLDLNKRNLHPSAKIEDDIFEVKQNVVVDGTKSSMMAIYGYSTFNYEHQILVYDMATGLKISSYTLQDEVSENSTLNISVVGTSENDGGLLIYGFKNGEGRRQIYFLNDLYDLNFHENAEAISQLLPDHVDAQLVVNRELSDKMVIGNNGKLRAFNINTKDLKKLRDKLKIKKLKKDQSDGTSNYYPYPYPSNILKTVLKMLENLNWEKSADLPAEFKSNELDSIKWYVNHWKKTGKTYIKVSELICIDESDDEKSHEWKDLDEYKCFPPREIFIYSCECIENGDLIMITKQGIMIFTIVQPIKKIRMRYFWDNESWREAWKCSRRLGITNADNEGKIYNFDDARRDLSRCEQLPPLNISRIIELYETFYIVQNDLRIWPFKELLKHYLQDISTLAKHGKRFLYKAIDAKKGNIVELICNMCTDCLEKDSGNFYLLKIIVKCLPKLQQNYPEIVTEFMERSSMILDHQYVIAINSEQTPFHGYARDVMIYERNTFWDYYRELQFLYYRVYNNIKNFIEKISGDDDDEKFGIPVAVFFIPFYKFSSFSPKFNLFSDFYKPKPNPFVKTYYPSFYNEWNAEALLNFKWNTYGKYYYYTNWTWFIIYLLIFSVGTLPLIDLSPAMKITLLSATIILGFIFFTFEVRDFIWRPRRYLKNFWNLFDCGAYLFPVITSVYWLYNGQPPKWLPTIANLLVDLKFLLFFRVFESFGRYFAIILGVAKHVFSFLVILFILMISFAHAFYILLSPAQTPSVDVPYNDPNNPDKNNPWLLTDQFYQMNPDGSFGQDPVLVRQPSTSTNMFAWPQTSLLAMYLFLTGDSSPFSPFNYLNNHSLALLTVAFSWTVIYLMNLFIGLLNMAIETNNDHANYLIEKAAIIAEIELFHLFPYQRRWRTWFPDVIYYEVPIDEVRKRIHLLDTKSSATYSRIISSRLRDIVDMPKPYNQQQQDLLSQFETINHFLKKMNDEGLNKQMRQFSISSIGPSKNVKVGPREIKMYMSSESDFF